MQNPSLNKSVAGFEAAIAETFSDDGEIEKRMFPDIRYALAFLNTVKGNDAAVTVECLPCKRAGEKENLSSEERAREPRIKRFQGRISDTWPKIEKLNQLGYNIYYVVNEMDGQIHSKAVMTGVRWVFADWDVKDFDGNWDALNAQVDAANSAMAYHLKVLSGHGIHLYWRVETITNKAEMYRADRVMSSLAKRFSADTSVADFSHIMRLPGSVNTKDKNTLILVTAETNDEPKPEFYTLDEMAAAFGESVRLERGSVSAEDMSVLVQRPDYLPHVDAVAANEAFVGGLKTTDVDDFRKVYAYLNPDMPEPDWRKHCGIIKGGLNGSEEGKDLWLAWSRGDLVAPEHTEVFSARKFDEAAALEKWARCRDYYALGDATLGSAITEARRNGFTGSTNVVEAATTKSVRISLLSDPVGQPAPSRALAEITPMIGGFGNLNVSPTSPTGFGGAAAQPGTHGSIFVTGDEMLAKPAGVDWLISGIMPRGAVGMLFGASGAGKSFLALDMALSIVIGRRWHEHHVKQGPVWYLAGEGFSGLKLRVRAWQKVHGAGSLARLNVTRNAVPFDADGAAILRSELDATTEMPALIIIDTLSRHLQGDENTQKDSAQFVRLCGELASLTGAAVLIVHHSGHHAQDRARGSSVLRAAVDVEMAITVKPGGFQLGFTKVKDGKVPPLMEFHLNEVEIGRGEIDEPVTSAVVEFRGIAIPRAPGRPAAPSEVLSLVVEHPGLTADYLRPKWHALGNPGKRLTEKLKRAMVSGLLRCDESGAWWPL